MNLAATRILALILNWIQLINLDMAYADPSLISTSKCDVDDCSKCSPSRPESRPYFRTALARSVYAKLLQDNEFENFDRSKVNIDQSRI